MSAPEPEIVTHNTDCWRVHDECALQKAKTVLEADQSTVVHQSALLTVNFVITDHAVDSCPQPAGHCHGVRLAREVLELGDNWPPRSVAT